MSELGDLLELLHGAGDSWRTARVTVRQWHHVARGRKAFERDARARRAKEYAWISEPAPETHERLVRVWIEKPDRAREESEDAVSVRDGDTWWTYHPGFGAHTNDGDPGHVASVGDVALPLLEPGRLLGSLSFEPAGEVVRARARPGEHLFALHGIGHGADEYELVVDPKRGILRRVTAVVDGEPFHVLELVEAAFDEELPPATFTFVAPEGVKVRRAGTDHEAVTLAEAAARAPFTVLAPREVPVDWRLHVVLLEQPPAVHLFYSSSHAGETVSIHETAASDRDHMAGAPWQERDGVLVFEPEERGHPAYVRVEREGTRATLSSQEVPVERLAGLARSLQPA